MKKILFIPHHPGFAKLKIRLAELARRLKEMHEVYLLDWHSALEKNNLAGRIEANLRDALRMCNIRREGGLNIVETPLLHRPYAAAPLFNSFWLNRAATQLKIDAVVNGSYYLFAVAQQRNFKYIIDFADFPTSGQGSAFDRFIDRSLRREIAHCDAVTVSSQGLVEYVRRSYGVETHFVPNGADLARFRGVSEREVSDVRRRHGLLDKWVIGHLGYIGDWVDVGFLVETLRDFKKAVPAAALLFVGSSPRLEGLKKTFASDDIVFAGQVDSALIEPYFLACDMGVLPNKKSVFQDMAFHIKIVEYAAARKFVVASDLEEVKNMNLPNVFVAPLEKQSWVEALLRAKNAAWQSEWDAALARFDWERIAGDFNRRIITP